MDENTNIEQKAVEFLEYVVMTNLTYMVLPRVIE